MTPRSLRAAGVFATAAGLFAAVLAGCATPETSPSATVTTLTPDAPVRLRVQWDAVPDRDAGRRLRGHVDNVLGEQVQRVRLLAQALDASGHVVAQRLEWVLVPINGFGRAYFEIPGMPPADRYRVTVWSYDRVRSVTS
jgi:hypothetical protein